ncbi:MAG TPA: hypothetical protein VKP67_00905 [Xanthobacteraceae bacterium]|nr:hypothetical protein [Xanthobacteraceae bacterium]
MSNSKALRRRQAHLTVSAEFIEALGRAAAKYGNRRSVDHVRDELGDICKGNSVCAGLTDDAAKHRAVAAVFPHLYPERGHA